MEKHCSKDGKRCRSCPFNLSPLCLMHIITNEFENYKEENKKLIHKLFINCSEDELSRIESDFPDVSNILRKDVSGKEFIDNIKKLENILSNLEVDILVEDE